MVVVKDGSYTYQRPCLLANFGRMPALHLSTIISRSSSSILSHISHLSKSFPNHPLLFTLSHNTSSADDLSNLVEKLTNFSSQSVGCLSAPLPGPHSIFTACSLAIFDPANVVTFRSTVPGRPQAQVGRWRPVGQGGVKEREWDHQEGCITDVKDWGDVWNRSAGTGRLPDELEGLHPDDTMSIIYMTDRAPEGLSNSLSQFSNSSKMGLVASSTPFVTGRPFTLFRNNNVYDSGAVGIALRKSKKPIVYDFSTNVSFLGMTPVSKPMSVTRFVVFPTCVFLFLFIFKNKNKNGCSHRCDGNMVISLEDQNPTQLLLSCIRELGLETDPVGHFKDDSRFALGVVENGALNQVFSITAGDPSRGAISLDTQRSPGQGATVQFLHRTKSLDDPLTEQGVLFTPCTSMGEPLFAPKSLSFFSVADDMFTSQASNSVTEEAYILSDMFAAASENGFLFSPKQHKPEHAWTCTVPGAVVAFECVS
ncbi:hypothetical protein AX15_007813 [Amanita polypyramis BW_CC]|nr:hypothetical protein AX15_007813 [Amanita polypyramis BW_CC]